MPSDNQRTARTAKIFQPAKTAMQSGKARTQKWLLEFDQVQPRSIDPIMGYTTASDTQMQVNLKFDTSEDAISYAERNGIAYRLMAVNKAKRRKMSYTDNFDYYRPHPWTH
jgi:hypothetical protein